MSLGVNHARRKCFGRLAEAKVNAHMTAMKRTLRMQVTMLAPVRTINDNRDAQLQRYASASRLRRTVIRQWHID